MFYRDTWIEINLDAIESNVHALKRHYVKQKVMIAVIKADAYGHGAVEVAKRVIRAGADWLAVATLDEALECRIHQIDAPILVLGNVPPQYLKLAANHRITLTVHSLSWLKRAVLENIEGTVDVHIKLDTGMHRIGLCDQEELMQVLALIEQAPQFRLTGIYSHLATADEPDDSYYLRQLNRLNDFLEVIERRDLLIHIANSMAAVKYSDELSNAVRIGIMLYGINPKSDWSIAFSFVPALSLYTRIIQCKRVEAGSLISYNGRYQAKTDEWIGTIPIGYADGLDRRYRDGNVFVDGDFCPIVGQICMDQTMIRLPNFVPEGTLVEIIGPHISVDEMAEKCGTISYHILTQLSKRLPRIYKSNGGNDE